MLLHLVLVVLLSWCAVVRGSPFRYLSYPSVLSRLRALRERHPAVVRLWSANEAFALPKVGSCVDDGDHEQACEIWVVEVGNSSGSHVAMPEVFFSGEIHGDERVGPTTLVELAEMLVTSENAWVRRLVRTRNIIMTPMTNAVGYHMNTRGEMGIDTNRDYPIDQPPGNCMRAVTSRAVNEIFRSHLVQLAVTFHGGMEAIALEWGTKTRENPADRKSPDDMAQVSTGNVMSVFAGGFPGTKRYPVGRMNDLVYAVYGGMEDWAYSGSWDPVSKRNPCNPSSNGGYPPEKTTYDDSMLRVVNILVETSDDKQPSESRLGSMKGVVLGERAGSGHGHVSRNVRLALSVIDMVQPWVEWTTPSIIATTVLKARVGSGVTLSFDVGGALTVDTAWLQVRSSAQRHVTHRIVVAKNKPTHWGSPQDRFAGMVNRLAEPEGNPGFAPLVSTCLGLPEDVRPGDRFQVRAVVQVDSSWGAVNPEGNPRNFPPQSHWVNARTNEAWVKRVGQHEVRGRVRWETEQDVVIEVVGESDDESSPFSCTGFEPWRLVHEVGNNGTTQGQGQGQAQLGNDTDVVVVEDTSPPSPSDGSHKDDDDPANGPANIAIPVVLLSVALCVLYLVHKRSASSRGTGGGVYGRLPTVAHHRVDEEEGLT